MNVRGDHDPDVRCDGGSEVDTAATSEAADAPTVDETLTELFRDRQAEARRVVIRAARAYVAEHHHLPMWWERRGAEHLNISGRHFRRLVNHDPHPRSVFVPTDKHLARLYAAHGVRTLAYKLCVEDEVEDTPGSYDTFARGIRERANQSFVAGARDGWSGIRATRAAGARTATHRGQVYALDHALSDVLVHDPVTGRVDFRWETTIIDEHTRLELIVATTDVRPDTASTVGALALAVEGWQTESGDFIGGMPDQVLSDNGGELRAHPASVGLIRLGVIRRFAGPKESQQNGKVERRQGGAQLSWQARLPGYVPRTLSAHERKRLVESWRKRPEQLITPVQYDALRLEESRRYNFERRHSALKKRTPWQAWKADDTPLRRGDPESIRLAMLASDTRTVDHGTIRFDWQRYYPEHDEQHPPTADLAAFNEMTVEVRYMPGRRDIVYVFHDGQFICKCRSADSGGGQNQAAIAATRERSTAKFLRLSHQGEVIAAQHAVEELQRLGAVNDSNRAPSEPEDGDSAWAERVPGTPRKAKTGSQPPQGPVNDPARNLQVDRLIAQAAELDPF